VDVLTAADSELKVRLMEVTASGVPTAVGRAPVAVRRE